MPHTFGGHDLYRLGSHDVTRYMTVRPTVGGFL